MERLRQLRLLIWKNLRVQCRQPIWTVMEFVLPTLLMIIVVSLQQQVPIEHRNITVYESYLVSGTSEDLLRPVDDQRMLGECFHPNVLFYAPNNSMTNMIMDIVQKRFDLEHTKISEQEKEQFATVMRLDTVGFQTEEKLVQEITKQFDATVRCSNQYIGGIVFQDGFTSAVSNLTEFRYKIRLSNTHRNGAPEWITAEDDTEFDQGWDTNLLYPIFGNLGPRESRYSSGGKPGYWKESFLTLQRAIDSAIIQLVGKRNDVNEGTLEKISHTPVALRRFPYAAFVYDRFILMVQRQLPMVLTLSYSLSVLYIIRSIVIEKEQLIKDYMRVMGLNNYVQWLAHFIVNYVKLAMVSATITFLLTCPFNGNRVVDRTDPIILLLFLLVYSASLISYCFAISVFFKSGNTAAGFGGILWFLLYIPYFFLQPRYPVLCKSDKLISSLLLNTGLAFAWQIIGTYEASGIGVQWANVGNPSSIGDNLSLAEVMGVLTAICAICLFLTWYMDEFSSSWSIRRFFPFTRASWRHRRTGTIGNEQVGSAGDSEWRRRVRMDSETCQETSPRVVIKDLTKIYGGGRTKMVALENLTVNMYAGQITALLGHNGAGKSTTMAVMTGMLSPTFGSVSINGFDISTDLWSARRYLGYCPQHNILFHNLTVYEHLKFFCQLKCGKEKPTQVEYLLTALGLQSKRDHLAQYLSGGTKRKLSLAIAFVGGSEIVLLDEPTSGMDPASRHKTWHFLQQQKQQRTILFTTHHMEEADLLADQIAIMARGRLQCYGSSMFLKRTYGAGFKLTALFKEKEPSQIRAITGLMMATIRSHIPEAKLQSTVAGESVFILPSECRTRLACLFAELEREQERYGVSSLALSLTSMEDVLLRVCQNAHDELADNANDCTIGSIEEERSRPLRIGRSPHYLQHIYAMLVKCWLYSWRNWLVLFLQLVIPLGIITTANMINQFLPIPVDMPPLVLNGTTYGRSTVAVYAPPHKAHGLDNEFLQNLSTSFVSILQCPNIHRLENGDILKYVMDEIDAVGQTQFDLQNIIGAAFGSGKETVTVYFNNQAYHGPGVAVNVMDNALLKLAGNSAHITTVNHPLPPTKSDRLRGWVVASIVHFNIAFNLLFALSFSTSSYVIFLVKERLSKVKHLQLLGGVHPVTFWLSTFIWHLISFAVTIAGVMAVFGGFQVEYMAGKEHWGRVTLLFMAYAWAYLPIVYLASFIFDTALGAFISLIVYNILTGLATMPIVAMLNQPLHLFDLSHKLRRIFTAIFPAFAFGQGVIAHQQNVFTVDLCQPFLPYCKTHHVEPCCGTDQFTSNYFGWSHPGIGGYLFSLLANGFVYLLLLLLIELDYFHLIYHWIQNCYLHYAHRTCIYLKLTINPSSTNPSENNTKDGANLESGLRTTANMDTDWAHSVLIASALEKRYGAIVAVDKLSFNVQSGQCFGLLGVNGAGKTSTFEMLTGEKLIDGGDALVNGISVRNKWRKAGQGLGYCPQFDAVIDEMTALEMVTMFARIRGIRERAIPTMAYQSLACFGISQYAHKLISTFSGGTKRKLSLAISLLGDPAVLLLDEPTSGVDPASRRTIWRVLSEAKKMGVAVLLTSHSMDECEALCNNLAVMIAGRVSCFGPPHQLKCSLGQAYSLVIKVKDEKGIGDVSTAVSRKFPGSLLKSVRCRQCNFRIPQDGNSWSSMFNTLEEMVPIYNIVDYTLTQTSLEEVFMNCTGDDGRLQRKNE